MKVTLAGYKRHMRAGAAPGPLSRKDEDDYSHNIDDIIDDDVDVDVDLDVDLDVDFDFDVDNDVDDEVVV